MASMAVGCTLKFLQVLQEMLTCQLILCITFTGVNSTMFEGGGGGEIILSKVKVYLHRTGRGNGFSEDLFDTVSMS